jgi:hypothetical protein
MTMKKVIGVAMLAAFVMFASASFAQDKAVKDQKATKQEVKVEKKDVPAEASNVKPAPKMPSMEDRAKQSVDRLAERVKDLTADQKKKLLDIHLASFKQADADKELAKTDMEKYKEASKARVTKMRDEVKAILTEAQWKVYTTPPPRPANPEDASKKVEVKDAPKEVKK